MERLFLISCLFVTCALSVDNLNVKFEWKTLDFDFGSPEKRQRAINDGTFKPEDNVPMGLEVYGDRLFLTVPRWKRSVAASLTYINITDPDKSPKLRPYPNWEAHESGQIVSPCRIRADQCGRLWVLDAGNLYAIEDNTTTTENTPKLLIYDLKNDTLIREFALPENQKSSASLFLNIAVEENPDNCEDAFAYLADSGTKPGLVVYSFESNASWRVTHNYFNMEPTSGLFTSKKQGDSYSVALQEGVLGMGLSKKDADGFATLYFHAGSSTDEFSVNTKFLRRDNQGNYSDFRHLGSRGPNGQSGASFLHQKTDVLFYTLPNLDAVACFRTTVPNYTLTSQGRVFMNSATMVWPSDVKVDSDDNLWVISDRLLDFLFDDGLDERQTNFRVFSGKVADVIRGTACDDKLIVSNKSKSSSGGTNAVLSFGALHFVVLCRVLNYYYAH